jgi:hypothetical protein
MDLKLQSIFIEKWNKYFGSVQLPICFYYSDKVSEEDLDLSKNEERCLIGNLNSVINGYPFVYDAKLPGCPGGKRYSGYTQKLRSNFDYFLSCGIPGKLEGERYKKSPELVNKLMKYHPGNEATGKYLVFKRWDKLREDENPLVVIFFASGDVLSGLFTLANYDMEIPEGVIAPFCSGCSSIITYPLHESKRENPKCILGMFDISARPYIQKNEFSFSIPFLRFEQMINNMDESFLITDSWKTIKNRIL